MTLVDSRSRARSDSELHEARPGGSAVRVVDAPRAWQEVEGLMARKIETETGVRDGLEVVISAMSDRSAPRLLTLGAGSCSLGIQWVLPRLADPEGCTLECIDPSSGLFGEAGDRSESLGVRFVGTAMDINCLELEPDRYDVILCWVSLHQYVELERIAAQIRRGLKRDGLFVTMDICSRNGFLLWPETRQVVNELWELLPSSYRVAHTLEPDPVLCELYPEVDCSKAGLQCLRSEAILPALERHLERRHLVFAHSLLRRFFDTMFGPNFDLSRPFDRAFFNLVRDYDEMALQTRRLRPETFFGVYRKRLGGLRPEPSLADIFGER